MNLYAPFIKYLSISGQASFWFIHKLHHIKPIPSLFPILDDLSCEIYGTLQLHDSPPSLFPSTLKSVNLYAQKSLSIAALLPLMANTTNLEFLGITTEPLLEVTQVGAVIHLLENNPRLHTISLSMVGRSAVLEHTRQILQAIAGRERLRHLKLYMSVADDAPLNLQGGFPALTTLFTKCHSRRFGDILACVASHSVEELDLELKGPNAIFSEVLPVDRFVALRQVCPLAPETAPFDRVRRFASQPSSGALPSIAWHRCSNVIRLKNLSSKSCPTYSLPITPTR